NWGWVFYVTVPVGITAFVLTFLIVPDLGPGRVTGIEPVGVLLTSAGLFAITFGLIEGQRFDWATVTTVAGVPITIASLLVAGVVLLIAFFVWDSFRPSPLVPLGLFRVRNFS